MGVQNDGTQSTSSFYSSSSVNSQHSLYSSVNSQHNETAVFDILLDKELVNESVSSAHLLRNLGISSGVLGGIFFGGAAAAGGVFATGGVLALGLSTAGVGFVAIGAILLLVALVKFLLTRKEENRKKDIINSFMDFPIVSDDLVPEHWVAPEVLIEREFHETVPEYQIQNAINKIDKEEGIPPPVYPGKENSP